MDATINQDDQVKETFLLHKKKMDILLVVPQTLAVIFGIWILWSGKARTLEMTTTAWLIVCFSLCALILHFYLQSTLKDKTGYNYLSEKKLAYRFLLRETEVFSFSYVAYPAACLFLERMLGISPMIPYPYNWLGLIIFIPATVGMIWILWVFGNKGKGTPVPFEATQQLITEGPYNYVRNPMEIAAVFMMVGLAIILSSYFVLISSLITAFQFHMYTVNIEELEMKARFGKSFEEYCQQVKRWIPRLKK